MHLVATTFSILLLAVIGCSFEIEVVAKPGSELGDRGRSQGRDSTEEFDQVWMIHVPSSQSGFWLGEICLSYCLPILPGRA